MERAKFAWAMMAAAALCAATATAATVVTSAASDSFRIDTREGPFESTGSETLTYSSRWNGGAGATVTIAQSCATPHTANGPLAAGLADEGEQPWSATYNGEYTLTHATVEGGATGVVETAVFRVTGLGWPQTGVRVAGCTNVYDGAAHTIGVETNGTIAGLTLRYAVGGDASTMRPDGRFVETSPPVFTDVTNVMVFVEASAPLYATTTNSAAVVITKAPLEAVVKGYTGVYDGKGHGVSVTVAKPATGARIRYCAGAPGGGSWTTSKPQLKNVGTVKVYVEISARGYFTTTNSATLKITPRALTVVADAKTKTQLSADPALTYKATGLVAGDAISGRLVRASGEAPGSYAISKGTLSAGANYAMTFKGATFKIVAAKRTLTVKTGKWGKVRVEIDGTTRTVGANATKAIPVLYGHAVKLTAVPDAGFGPAGNAVVSYGSFTKDATAAFAFVPKLSNAKIRWKFSSAVGRYFAQVSVPSYAGYNEALNGLAFIFADRKNSSGVYAQLWDASARAPRKAMVKDLGVTYRGVSLGASAFAGKGGGKRVVFGVSDATLSKSDKIVPAGERQIGLYVRKRVSPVSGNETAGEVGNFIGYLTWTSAGTRYFMPVLAGSANGGVSTSTAGFKVETHAYSPKVLGVSTSLGLRASSVANRTPKVRIATFSVKSDGSVSGRVEAVASNETSSSFAFSATVHVYSSKTPSGAWHEVAKAKVDRSTGKFSLPAGSVVGSFFRATITTETIFE